MLCILRAREIRASITRRINLWERGLHVGLVGCAEVMGDIREGKNYSGGEGGDKDVARCY